MRRTLALLIALLVCFVLTGAAPKRAKAALLAPTAVTHTATCALTTFTLSGPVTLLSGAITFTVNASGTCIGTSSSVNVGLTFNSVGPWSCAGGAALGYGWFTPNNGSTQQVSASLANTGGEYVVELHNPTSLAAGQFTTLPIACTLGQPQPTIAGTGTLTFSS